MRHSLGLTQDPAEWESTVCIHGWVILAMPIALMGRVWLIS